MISQEKIAVKNEKREGLFW